MLVGAYTGNKCGISLCKVKRVEGDSSQSLARQRGGFLRFSPPPSSPPLFQFFPSSGLTAGHAGKCLHFPPSLPLSLSPLSPRSLPPPPFPYTLTPQISVRQMHKNRGGREGLRNKRKVTCCKIISDKLFIKWGHPHP